jgi:hypothetical protein
MVQVRFNYQGIDSETVDGFVREIEEVERGFSQFLLKAQRNDNE